MEIDFGNNCIPSSLQSPTQIIIMSEAGKPIFSSSGDAESLAKACGMLQAIRTSVMDPKANLGDIQTLKTNLRTIVFMSVGSLTLVAISSTRTPEAHLKLQLEYLYSHIIFTMTNRIQDVFAQCPGYQLDIGDSAFQSILCDISTKSQPNYLTGGAKIIGPFSSRLRESCSKALQTVGSKTPNTVFAILLVGNQILTMIQPSYIPHQLTSSDLRLIVRFVNSQSGLLTSELWFPVCLPRFNASGFLHVYTSCLAENEKLSLVLISQLNSMEQFEEFRRASDLIRRALEIPEERGSILRIMERTQSQRDSHFDDAGWTRNHASLTSLGSGSISGHGDDVTSEREEIFSEIPVEADCILLKELRKALDEKVMISRMEEYRNYSKAIHFVFRLDVPIRSGGKLTQCISAPLPEFPFVDEVSKQHVWTNYHRLCLRMRLGTCTTEATVDALENLAPQDHENIAGIGSRCCPAMRLTETPPNVSGISYILDGELFLAMNGRDFELYMTFSSTVPVKKAASLGTKLARRLFADEQKLFLMTPLVWKD